MTDESEEPSLFRRVVRTEILYTVLGLFVIVLAYGYFFLDDNLEWGLEYVLGRSVGAEVNIGDLRTGWLQPTIRLHDLKVTDPSTPATNAVDVGTMGVVLNLDALLRLKLLVEDASIEGLRFGTPRQTPGWVSEEGGDVRWVYEKLLTFLSTQFEETTAESVFGNAGSLLAGESLDSVLEEHRGNLVSQTRLETVREDIGTVELKLEDRFEKLPDKKEIKDLKKRVQSLEGSSKRTGSTTEKLRTIADFRKTVRRWEKDVKAVRDDVTADLSGLETSVRKIDASLNEDITHLRSKMTLPELTLENPSQELFRSFVAERGGMLHDLLSYYQEYGPAGSEERSSEEATAESSPEADHSNGGRDFQFQTRWSYPDFWLREFRLSGGGTSPDAPEYSARINNISTYGPAVGAESGLAFRIERPTQDLETLTGNVGHGHQGGETVLRYQLTLEGLRIDPWTLVSNERLTLGLTGGNILMDFSGNLRGNLHTSMVNLRMEDPEFAVSGSSNFLKDAVQHSLKNLGHVELQATGKGTQETMEWRVQSNLGDALEDGVHSFVQQRADEIKREVIEDYRGEIQEQKAALEDRYQSLRKTYLEPIEERRKEINRIEGKLKEIAEETAESSKVDSFKKFFD